MTIKLFCNICGKEIEAHGLGFENKQATKMGFYIEFSHHIDPTRLLTETLVCDGCKRELRKAFSEAVEVLNTKIRSLKVKGIEELRTQYINQDDLQSTRDFLRPIQSE